MIQAIYLLSCPGLPPSDLRPSSAETSHAHGSCCCTDLCASNRILAWLSKRLFTIPNQSSVAKAFAEFDEAGRMRPSPYYDRIVDVMEELVRFTVLLRPHVATLTDRYSERKEANRPIDVNTDLSAIALRQ